MALGAFNAALQDDAGNALANVEVEVRNETNGALAVVYSDRAGAVSLGNPFTWADGKHLLFYVVDGAYKIIARKGSDEQT
jgi:hypothetical protein